MYNSGRRGKRAPDGYGVISVNDKFNQTSYPIPIIDSWSITDGSYNPIDDTALDPAGGQTIVLYGSGFASGATVNINGSNIGIVTVLDSNRITFTSPALSAASYTIYVSNTDGATAIYVPGLVYSGLPTWSSPASGSIGTSYETKNASTLSYTTFTATGDATITYSIVSGNLPSGVTLSSSGELSGTLPATSSPTTYSFTIRASDGQNQDSDRAFSLTINPDAVTWVAPTLNGSLSVYETQAFSTPLSATSAAGYGVMYSADTLPTGITLNPSTGALVGYANTVGNTNAQLTATANTTGRYTTSNVTFTVNQDVVTWSSPDNNTEYGVFTDTPISNVTLSSTSAAGYGVQYTANALPTGVTLSGNTISGTPTQTQTVYTQLTATANTTNRVAYRYISWTVSILGDSYFKNTPLLLSANSSIQTSSFVSDNSINNQQLTVVGDTRASNFNPYQHGYYSYSFDGAGDAINAGSNSNFAFGTGPFCIEAWMYNNVLKNYSCLVTTRPNNSNYADAYHIGWDSVGGISLYVNTTSSPGGASGTIKTGKWQHFVCCRDSNNITSIFVDGVRVGTATITANFTRSLLGIGDMPTTQAEGINGFISNLRLVKGYSVYDPTLTTLTVPTAPLQVITGTSILTAQSPRFIDNSAVNSTLTKVGDTTVSSGHPFPTPTTSSYNTAYSTYFDGNGDYLSTASGNNLSLNGDFTIECWVYFKSIGGGYQMILTSDNNSHYLGITNSVIDLNIGTDTVYSTGGVPFFTTNSWTHFAATRAGNTIRFFVNGVLKTPETSPTNTSTGFTTGPMTIGGWSSGATQSVNGYVSNFRVIKGTALYTSTFTPPTSALTAVAGTVLLTCVDPTFKDNSANNMSLSVTGNTVPVIASPFTMTTANTTVTSLGSAYFDGTGDYLTEPKQAGFEFGTGDFTVEGWFYFWGAFSTTYNGLIMLGEGASGGGTFTGWGIITGGTGTDIRWYRYDGTETQPTASYTIPIGQWQHIAVTRSGTTLRIFVNGTQLLSTTNSTSYNSVNSDPLYIGRRNDGVSGITYAKMYTSDIRIIKGTALYTSNFLPPQAPLTPVANTQLLTLQSNGSHNNNTFKDSSSFNNVITRNGNVTNGTFSPYGDNWSVYFNGSSDYVTMPATVPLTGNFTIEGWFNLASYATRRELFDQNLQGSGSEGRLLISISAADSYKLAAFVGGTTGAPGTILSDTVIQLNTWYHFAYVRNNNTFSLYVNGVREGTQPTGTISIANQNATFGYNQAQSTYWAGNISNFRISNTAVYNSNFTPSTSPLPVTSNTLALVFQTPRIIDTSTKMVVLTSTGTPTVQKFSPFGTVTVPKYYSTYFDGTGDYLTVSSPGTPMSLDGDFTVEFWVYPIGLSDGNYYHLVSSGYNGQVLKMYWAASGGFVYYYNGGSFNFTANTSMVTNNTWHHFAWVRSGGNSRLYINGTGYTTVSSSMGTINWSSSFNFSGASSNENFPGYMSNLRVVKGNALYDITSSTITVPTGPLSRVSGTSLLIAQSATMVDNSTNNFTVTGSGDAKPIAVSPFTPTASSPTSYSPTVFGGSMYFDGSADYVTGPSPICQFGTGDFTVEFWAYLPTSTSNMYINSASTGAPAFLLLSDGRAIWQYRQAVADSIAVSGASTVGQWNHWCVTRQSNSVKFFKNGVQIGTTVTVTENYSGSYGVTIGQDALNAVGNNSSQGYISDLKITKGVALYTSTFYPGSAPATPTTTIGTNTYSSTLLLNGTSGGVIDATRTVDLETVADAKVTNFSPYNGSYYSNYFDGTGDYLSLTNNAAFDFGTEDFTIEGWFMLTADSTANGDGNKHATIFAAFPPNGGSLYTDYNMTLAGNTTTTGTSISFGSRYVSTTSKTVSYTTTVTKGVWHHFAYCKTGTTGSLYYDGNRVAQADAYSTVNSGGYDIRVGSLSTFAASAYLQYFPGYISNLRVVKGSQVYTGATYTVPTSPLTAVSGTSLLTCQSNKFIDNSTNNFTITTNGDTKVATQNPFQVNTGQSYYFDGTGDYLKSPQISFGTGDFTIECWSYLLAKVSGVPAIFSNYETWTTGALALFAGHDSATTTYYNVSSNGTFPVINAGTIKYKQWQHLALVRSGNTLSLYVDGVSVGTANVSGVNYTGVGSSIYIGTAGDAVSTGYIQGYLSDYKITKGYARYTTNFTPTATPLLTK